MKTTRTTGARWVAVAAASAALLAVASGVDPSWWSDHGVIDPLAASDDYRAANAGQLKNIATWARQEMEEELAQFGGAGPAVAVRVAEFNQVGNYEAINQGQLKYVAEPFYARLIEIGYCNDYPWGTANQDDYGLMNIGQLKNIFSFDLALDSDADGMPDWWEEKHGLNPLSGVDPSLKAWWKFDEETGSQAIDATGNGYDGTIATPDRYVDGRLGSALEFNGINDAVTIPQPSAIIDGNTFTISAWVWLDSDASAQYHPAVADLTGDLRGYWLGFDKDFPPDKIELFWGDGTDYYVVGESNQSLYRGQWAHAVGTCDGTTKSFYLNGGYVDSRDTPPFEPAEMPNLLIGEDFWGYSWKGKIDDVRIYTEALNAADIGSMYDALTDPDDDDLSSLDEYDAGTDPWLGDTDQDGLEDGEEVNQYLTDPTDVDSDDDGLKDGEEVIVHQTDPLSRDTDLDWAADGFEVDKGADPTVSQDTPTLRVVVNEGASYATSPNLMLSFPGLAADAMIVGQTCDLTDGILFQDPAAGLLYMLVDQAQSAHAIHAHPIRGEPPGEEATFNLVGMAILDTEAPQLTVTSPIDQSTTSRPWVRIEGTTSDEVSPVTVLINGEWPDGIGDGAFWYVGPVLGAGENVIVVTARDEAGNTSEQSITVYQNLSTDITAPTVAFDLAASSITVSDRDTLPVRGTTDDETAVVEFVVTSGGEVTGPFPVQVIGQDLWAEIPLQTGDNVVDLTATDAAGNQSSEQYTITRTQGMAFFITSPTSYQLLQAPDVVVHGVGPADFIDATITVNGVPTTITPAGDHVTFETTTAVPLDTFLTDLVATAVKDGNSAYETLLAKGYEILSHEDRLRNFSSGFENLATTDHAWEGFSIRDFWWDTDEKIYHQVFDDYTRHCYWPWPWPAGEGPCEDDWIFSESHDPWPDPPGIYGVFDDTVFLADCDWHHSVTWAMQDTSLSFRKFVPGVDKQLVVMHFNGMDYDRAPGEAFDPSLITFRGEPGFWYNEAAQDVGFLFEIVIGETCTISRQDFTWPECDYYEEVPEFCERQVKGRFLCFGEWGNDEVKVSFVSGTCFRVGTEEEHPDTEPLVLGYEAWKCEYRIEPEKDYEVEKVILTIHDTEEQGVWIDENLDGRAGLHEWGAWPGTSWPPPPHKNKLVDPHKGPYEARLHLLTEGRNAFSPVHAREVPVTANAIAARVMTGYGGHIDATAGQIESLHYACEVDHDLEKDEALKADLKLIWYSFTHGITDQDLFVGIGPGGEPPPGEVIFPSDLPENLNYTLVFLNGCKSATEVGASRAFQAQFGADVYIGWSDRVAANAATSFAYKLFDELDGRTPVATAVSRAKDRMVPGSDEWLEVDQKLVWWGDGNIIVDLEQ